MTLIEPIGQDVEGRGALAAGNARRAPVANTQASRSDVVKRIDEAERDLAGAVAELPDVC
jgi:hypothetical protein